MIGYPTDTVYGLGCDLLNKQATDRLYQIKGMPRDHELAFICPDLSDIAKYAVVENQVYRVLKHFLPGPYCFILQATREVPKLVQTKRKTVGIRVPDHPVTIALVRELGRPLISTTANRMGEAPLVDPWEIDQEFPGLEPRHRRRRRRDGAHDGRGSEPRRRAGGARGGRAGRRAGAVGQLPDARLRPSSSSVVFVFVCRPRPRARARARARSSSSVSGSRDRARARARGRARGRKTKDGRRKTKDERRARSAALAEVARSPRLRLRCLT